MAPKGKAKAKGGARAKAAALARRVAASNDRRDQRRTAAQNLNRLATELGVGQAAVDARAAPADEIDRLIRLLERRITSDGHLERLREAAKTFTDNGGLLSSEVVTEETGSASLLTQHRVLASFFKLKSKTDSSASRFRAACPTRNQVADVLM